MPATATRRTKARRHAAQGDTQVILNHRGEPIQATQTTDATTDALDALLAKLSPAQLAALGLARTTTTTQTPTPTPNAPVQPVQRAPRTLIGSPVYWYLRRYNTDGRTANGKVSDVLSTIGKSSEMRARLKTRAPKLAARIIEADAQGDVFGPQHPIVVNAPAELRAERFGATWETGNTPSSFFAWAWSDAGELCVIKPYRVSDRHETGFSLAEAESLLRQAMAHTDGKVPHNAQKNDPVSETPVNGQVAERVAREMRRRGNAH